MNTQLKRLFATARQSSSTDTSLFAPELVSRPRAKARLSRVLNIRVWAEGKAFSVHITQCDTAGAAALPLSFPVRFQYG